MSGVPKSYRTMAEFEREAIRPDLKYGFSLDDLMQDTTFEGIGPALRRHGRRVRPRPGRRRRRLLALRFESAGRQAKGSRKRDRDEQTRRAHTTQRKTSRPLGREKVRRVELSKRVSPLSVRLEPFAWRPAPLDLSFFPPGKPPPDVASRPEVFFFAGVDPRTFAHAACFHSTQHAAMSSARIVPKAMASARMTGFASERGLASSPPISSRVASARGASSSSRVWLLRGRQLEALGDLDLAREEGAVGEEVALERELRRGDLPEDRRRARHEALEVLPGAARHVRTGAPKGAPSAERLEDGRVEPLAPEGVRVVGRRRHGGRGGGGGERRGGGFGEGAGHVVSNCSRHAAAVLSEGPRRDGTESLERDGARTSSVMSPSLAGRLLDRSRQEGVSATSPRRAGVKPATVERGHRGGRLPWRFRGGRVATLDP